MWTICSTIWRMASTVCARRSSVLALPSGRALISAVFFGLAPPAAAAEPLKVFAAASLTDALDEALKLCAPEATGVYAGSGTLARQIANGAPADLYISANPQWMDWLEARGLIAGDARTDLLGNRLVLVVNTELHERMQEMDIEMPEFMFGQRIAVANVETVPAGIYARQALESRGLDRHPNFAGALVQASNVREALAWVARGETGFAVVYATDAGHEPRVSVLETFEDGEHDPIRYPAAIIADGNAKDAKRLLACLESEEASTLFRKFGFKK